LTKTTPNRRDVSEAIPDSPFAIIGKAAVTFVACIIMGLAIGLLLLKLLTPWLGALTAAPIAIGVALVGYLMTIHLFVKKYFTNTSKDMEQ